MTESAMITGAQIRAARAFLDWTAAELAERASVGISTVQRIEAESGPPNARGGNIAAIHDALVKAGIVFLSDEGAGPGIRGKIKRRRE
jgi:transcriptional regulator with XRE-family HTH domain